MILPELIQRRRRKRGKGSFRGWKVRLALKIAVGKPKAFNLGEREEAEIRGQMPERK